MTDIEDRAQAAERDQTGHHWPREQIVTQILQPIDQRGQAYATEQKALHIEAMAHGLANIGHIEGDQDQSGQTDGHIDKEDPAPRAIGNKEPAQDRANHRPQQGGHGQIGHGPHQIGLLDGLEQDQTPDRQHHRSGSPAQHAGENQLREGLGQAT